MRKNGIIMVILAIALVIFLFFISRDDRSKACVEDNCFVIEVVSEAADRERGLMFREELNENAGMLFVFENEGNYPFWMKNTLIPLDIIWMDSSGKIVDIKEALPCEADPCTIYNHAGSAKYVLEINKGLSSSLGIEVGETVKSLIIGNMD